HKHGETLSIRNPTKAELCTYSDLLSEIISLIKPQHIVAVGKKAEFVLTQKGFSCIYVRHPSHGGAGEFTTHIEKLFDNL
ncbi:MAG: uracil-DNA glycosylase, partial [Thermodesulfobacteriota bacterium]